MLNVYGATPSRLLENEEIRQLQVILGLRHEETYDDCDDLASRGMRYGRVLLMTDQDHDGFHIRGLFINFIHHFWPALLKRHGFVEQLVTPIVKATRGKETLSFYSLGEYEEWREREKEKEREREEGGERERGERGVWRVKYYKGLGTSTAEEGREYFRRLHLLRSQYMWDYQIEDVTRNGSGGASDGKCVTKMDGAERKEAHPAIELAFAKENANDRKKWLIQYMSSLGHTSPEKSPARDSTETTKTSTVTKQLSLSDFIHGTLIQFSHADNVRAIPSVVDGLKQGQRKILHACLMRRLNQEMKVSQLSGAGI